MAICRIHRTHRDYDFTFVPNSILRDENLSNAAKGLFSIINGLPEDWDLNEAGLAEICKDDETSIRSSLKELEDNGYLVRTKEVE